MTPRMARRVISGCAALAISASLALAKPLARQDPAPATTPTQPTTGPELFVSSGCSHCHTIDGAGGTRGPNLSGIGRRWKDDAIRSRILAGTLEMPAYADVLSAPDLDTLVAYLHTRKALAPGRR